MSMNNYLDEDTMRINKVKFIEILSKALENRPGAKVEELLSKLENSDFFEAPASTKYHSSFRGGLVDHCLNVYFNAMSIARNKHLIKVYKNVPETKDEEGNIIEAHKELVEGCIDEDSIAIVTLLHDFSKMNFYKIDYRNKKVYCESGSKRDEGGKFDWVVEKSYAVIPQEERFLYGSHEETAEFMVRQFIPLTYEESTAILHHHFSLSFDSIKDPGIVTEIYCRYPIAALLHIADCISTVIDEGDR